MSTQTGVYSGSGSIATFTHGLTINEGDLLLIQYTLNTGGALSWISLDGFTADYAIADVGVGANHSILSKVAGANEPTSYTLQGNVGGSWKVSLTVITNADTSNPYHIAPQATSLLLSGTTTKTIPSVTTTGDNTLVFGTWYTTISGFTSVSVSGGAGWVEEGSSSSTPPMLVASKEMVAAGSTGDLLVTADKSATVVGWSFAINLTAGGGGGGGGAGGDDSTKSFTTLNEWLREQGYTGASADMTVQWLESNGVTRDQINTMWFEYLEGLGLTGTLTDKLGKWRD